MISLIKNEFKKLFGRKIMLVLFLIALGFVLLSNILYNLDSVINEEEWIKEELAFYEEELKTLDYKTVEDNEYYIDIKTSYDLIKLKLNYGIDSWQYNYIDANDSVYTDLWNINENTYGLNKDERILQEAIQEFNSIKQKLDAGNWKIFVREELDYTNEEIASYEKQLKSTEEKTKIKEITGFLEFAKINKQVLEWRLEKEIPYDYYNFLSVKLEEYQHYAETESSLKNEENKDAQEEQYYNEALKQMNICKYYIENNIVIENEFNAGYILGNLMFEFGTFIAVFSVIIAGTIVSNEFQKGTIKLLLTKPFSRKKILFSKYIVSILVLLMFIIMFAILQFIVGGFVSGFDVFEIPVVNYDLSTNSIVVMSVFKHLILTVLTSLPMHIFSVTLAFALSTITINSTVAVAIPILVHTIGQIVNVFIRELKILRFFITANWDLSIYLFGGKGLVEGLNLWISLVITAVHILIMLIITFIVFKERDIKNL